MTDDPETNRDADVEALARAIGERRRIDWEAVVDRGGNDASVLQELEVLDRIARVLGPGNVGEPSPTRIGKTWGPLTILERIGRGAYGEVYRARDRRLDRDVALKLLTSDALRVSESDVVDEARHLARVRHPNVVTVHGAECIDGQVGLWTELVRGETLAQAVERSGPFATDRVIDIGIELCGALSAVHAAGLVHRDVKAQNVMMTPDGQTVLMDFGAVDDTRFETPSPRLAGTPAYVAPEIWRGASATARSDVFSLGVLLSYLWTGRFPRAPIADATAASWHLGTSTPLADAHVTSPALEAVLARALADDPDRRIQTAAEFAEALTRVRAGLAPPRFRVALVTLYSVLTISVLALTAVVVSRSVSPAPPGSRQKLPFTCESECLPSRDGRYVSLPGRSNVMLRATRTGKTRQVTFAPTDSGFPVGRVSRLSRRNELVAYQWSLPDGSRQLRVSRVASGLTSTLTNVASWDEFQPIDWTSDSTKILALLRKSDRWDIALVPIDGQPVLVLASLTDERPGLPSISPDGRYVTWDARGDRVDRDIFVADWQARTVRPLVTDSSMDYRPVWTPDSQYILFMSDRGGPVGAWLLPMHRGAPNGGSIQAVKDFGDVSPRGFTDSGDLVYEVSVSDFDVYLLKGSKVAPPARVSQQLVGRHLLPAWSRDGRQLAYITDWPRTGSTLTVRDVVSGQEYHLPIAVEVRRGIPDLPRWSPDGRSVVIRATDAVGRRGYFQVDVRTGAATALLLFDGGEGYYGPFSWLPSGEFLYVHRTPIRGSEPRLQSHLIVRDLRTRAERTINSGRGIGNLEVSADGQRIALDRRGTIEILGPTGELLHSWPVPEPFALHGWHGYDVFLTRFEPKTEPETNPHRLYRMDIATGLLRDTGLRIPAHTQGLGRLSLHPSGETIAFTKFPSKIFSEIWMANALAPQRDEH